MQLVVMMPTVFHVVPLRSELSQIVLTDSCKLFSESTVGMRDSVEEVEKLSYFADVNIIVYRLF